MLLIYGNDYIENQEEWNKSRPTDMDMECVLLDFLESVECLYEYIDKDNKCVCLPKGWRSSSFWRIEE